MSPSLNQNFIFLKNKYNNRFSTITPPSLVKNNYFFIFPVCITIKKL